jgi:hypothetical protein
MMDPKDREMADYYVKEIEGCIDEQDFQAEFFSSLADQWVKKSHLSPKQMACLQRIYGRVTGS